MPTAAPTAPHPKLVPTTVASGHTGLKTDTLRKLVRDGLPCVRIGPKFYFDLEKVDAWLDRVAESAAGSAAAANAASKPQPAEPPGPDPYREVIKRLVDAAPPLTADQAAKIRAVLGGAG
jgi:hypothetical protein